MKLLIFNGSPRGARSNSTILANQFLNGFHKYIEDDVPLLYLSRSRNRENYLIQFEEADTVIFIFPLYTDSMPGIVKEFFEEIYRLPDKKPKSLGFIVQSGFPEAIHCQHLSEYLESFTRRCGNRYLGTVTKGGVEGIQIQPPFMTQKLYSRFYLLGEHFARTGEFSQEIMKQLAKPYRLSLFAQLSFRMLMLTGITNFYWNRWLKSNNAYQRRFDKPFESIE